MIQSILNNHYLEIGCKEGRAKNEIMLKMMFGFNSKFYKNNFTDLLRDDINLFEHFMNYGFHEFRNCMTDKILDIGQLNLNRCILLLNCPYFVNTKKTRNNVESFKKYYFENLDNKYKENNIQIIFSDNISVVSNIIEYCRLVIYLGEEKNYNLERIINNAKNKNFNCYFINNIYDKGYNVKKYKNYQEINYIINYIFNVQNNFIFKPEEKQNMLELKSKYYTIQIIGLMNITCSISQNIDILKKNYKNCIIRDISDFTKNNINYDMPSIICIQPIELLTIVSYLKNFIQKPSVFWVCEFNEISQIYLELQNYFNKVLVPSDFCHKIFSKYLYIPVNKIKYESIIHDYLDQIKDHKIENEKINKILDLLEGYDKYGYCFDCNSDLSRKNILNLVKAFQDFPDKKLILKFREKRDDNIFSLEEEKRYYEFKNIIKNSKNIFYIDDELNNLDLYKLYTHFDYYISPHLGEGYGLTIYDNMILGNKIISPFFTGETEYLDKKSIIELPITYVDDNSSYKHTITQESIEIRINNQEILSYQYFKKYYDKYENLKKIILIISLFDCSNELRINELKTVLDLNLLNPIISKICILYERKNGSFDYLENNEKINLVLFTKRPTFNDYFKIANHKYEGDICMVANNDIFFNMDLYKIKNIENLLGNYINKYFIQEDKNILHNTIFTLTRYNIININKFKQENSNLKTYQIDYDYMRNHASQDVWIFKSPIKLLQTDIMIGTFTSDSFLNAQIIHMGYDYYNISNQIKCFHLQKELSVSQINNNIDNSIYINKDTILNREDFYKSYVCKIREYGIRLSVVGINYNGKYFYPTESKKNNHNKCIKTLEKIIYFNNQQKKFLKINHCSGCNECSWDKFFPKFLLDLDRSYFNIKPQEYKFKKVYNFKGIDIPIQKQIISECLQYITKISYFNTKSNLFEEFSFTFCGKDKLIFDNIITTNHIKIWYQNIMKLDIEKENFIRFNNFNIIISGIGKNISSYIPRLKENIVFINNFFPKNKIFIYENDSTDNSVELLKKYFGKEEFLSEKNIYKKSLGQYQNMAIARQKCRDFINSQHDSEYQYILLIDTDLHNNLYMTHIQKALEVREKYDVQFANGIYMDKYYWDTFATRTVARNIPFYYEIDKDGVNKYWKEVTNIPEVQKEIENQFTEVISAFGGIALYKKECFHIANYNIDIPDCEHVPFHKKLSRFGKKMVINRDFIKKYSIEETIGGYYHPQKWENGKIVKKKNN